MDPNSVVDFEQDNSSDMEDAAISRAANGGGMDEYGGEDVDPELEVTKKDLKLGLNHQEHTPLQGVHHERKVYLPGGLYEQPEIYPPLLCVNGCTEKCGHGPVGGACRYGMPLLWSRLFFINSVFEMLARNTNAYAASKDAGVRGRRWHDVTAAEIKVCIGLLVCMSVMKQSRVVDFWFKDEDWPNHKICRFMALGRFQQISRYFHASPPATSLPRKTDGLRSSSLCRRYWSKRFRGCVRRLRR